MLVKLSDYVADRLAEFPEREDPVGPREQLLPMRLREQSVAVGLRLPELTQQESHSLHGADAVRLRLCSRVDGLGAALAELVIGQGFPIVQIFRC